MEDGDANRTKVGRWICLINYLDVPNLFTHMPKYIYQLTYAYLRTMDACNDLVYLLAPGSMIWGFGDALTLTVRRNSRLT